VYKLFVVIDNGILSESGVRGEVVVDNLALRIGNGKPNVSPVRSTRLVVGSPSSVTSHLQSGFRGLRQSDVVADPAIVDEGVMYLEHD
jgi:hypothetical protein